jgi:dsRNA-specific ribonuclease
MLQQEELKALEEFRRFFLCTIVRKQDFYSKSKGFLFVPVVHSIEENPFSVSNLTQLMRREESKDLLDRLKSDTHNITDQLCGKVVITTYNDIAYNVHKVDFSLTPLSNFSTKKGQSLTLQEYYSNKRSLSIKDLNQPLLVHVSSSVSGAKDIQTQEINTEADILMEDTLLYLIPEFCQVTAISGEMQQFGRFLPHVWSHIQNYFKLDKFEHQNNLDFKNKRLLKQVRRLQWYSKVTFEALTHPSYSNENEGALTNNQRLEFIGDAVLDFVITTKIFPMFPTAPEGRLTCLKSSFVNNSFLALLADRLHLQDFIIVAENQALYVSTEKTLADAFEAILGILSNVSYRIITFAAALYLDQGIDEVLQFYTKVLFVDTKDNPLLDFWQFFDCLTQDPLGLLLNSI